MDKPSSAPQEKETTPSQDTGAQAQAANPPAMASDRTASFGSYGPQSAAIDPRLTSDAWKDSRNTAWSSTMHGRIAIRAFSRGLLGAAFFAAGGLLTTKWMAGKNAYDHGKTFLEQKNPLQRVAKVIDFAIGKPIYLLAEKIAGEQAAINFVRFRPTKYRGMQGNLPADGRSLGSEVVNVTFDFFAASIGDALGRDLADMVDPHNQKPWRDEDGHLDLAGAVKKAGKRAFRYVTYNGGEDWAVSIPYVYFMKAQRRVIDRISPGFKYDSDRALQGGSFKVDDNCKVIGGYGTAGAIDLQTRFTFYNIGTLMYREVYNHIADKLQGKPSSLYGAPDADKSDKTLTQRFVVDPFKWTLRSAVKGIIYMTPSVPLFWITRSPQHRSKGVFVNQKRGILEHSTGSRINSLRVHELKDPTNEMFVPKGTRLFYSNYDNKTNTWHPETVPAATFPNPFDEHFSPFTTHGDITDRVFDGMGYRNSKFNEKITNSKLLNDVDRRLSEYNEKIKAQGGPEYGPLDFRKALGINFTEQYVNKLVNATISYTPYMASKAEFANMWDDGKMDLAAERLIDGATHFNWGEFKAGAGEVWHSILRRPLADPAREAEAQRRIELDSSAPVSFTRTQAQRRHARGEFSGQSSPVDSELSWKDRLFSGRAKEKPAQKPDSRPRSFAEQEAMKKALEELTPPTSAIH